MQTSEKPKSQEQYNDLELQEQTKISTVDQIKILRQKAVKALKIAGIGIAGVYLGANALKPQIAESILSNTYEYSTSETVQKFVENENKPVNLERNKYRTYLTPQGDKVRYIEYENKGLESKMNGEGKILIEFAGIDGQMPINNDKGFEKTIRIIYDSKKMSPEGIKHQAKNISQMINANFGNKYKISSSSTSFGGLLGSFIKGVKFENQSTYAPFVGESAVVQEVTKLPIPVSLFHKDQYDNVIKNPVENLRVTVPESDGLTGGKKQILEAYPQAKVIGKSNHTEIDIKSADAIRINTSEKYKLFKEQNDKITRINKEYEADVMNLFSNRSRDLLNIADKTNIELEKEFLIKFPNRDIESKSYSRFVSENSNLKIRSIGLKYLNLHDQIISQSRIDEKNVKEEYKLSTSRNN